MYRNVSMRLPVRSRGIVVVTGKVPSWFDRHGRQCRSSGPSLTLELGRQADIKHVYSGVNIFTQLVTYCREVMTKNEHTIWAARFSPSLYVKQWVSLPSVVAIQRRWLFSCDCRAPANHCVIWGFPSQLVRLRQSHLPLSASSPDVRILLVSPLFFRLLP